MGQSRLMSLIESSFDIAMGFMVSLIAAQIIFPLFDIETSVFDDMSIVGLFTLTSLGRRYITRRLFNYLHIK